MAQISIHRDHSLGFERACEAARQWMDGAASKMGLECRVEPPAGSEQLIRFKRSGVDGTMRITANRIELDAKLGMMMAGLKGMIEQQITSNLDKLLGRG